MSNYSVYKTKICNLTAPMLKDAITSLARQTGMQVVSTISGREVIIGLRSQTLPNGIGFTLDKSGTVIVQGYAYGYQKAEYDRVSTLAQEYIRAYIVAENARNTIAAAKVNVKVMQKQVILEVLS